MWTTKEAAEFLGIQPDTLHTYVSRGYIKAPEKFGIQLMWDPEYVRKWSTNRLGRGRRTDLK